MRKLLIFSFAFVLCTGASAQNQPDGSSGMVNFPCEGWTKAISTRALEDQRFFLSWVNGFLAGGNTALFTSNRAGEVVRVPGSEEISARITVYCADNPASTFGNAALKLRTDLSRKQGR